MFATPLKPLASWSSSETSEVLARPKIRVELYRPAELLLRDVA